MATGIKERETDLLDPLDDIGIEETGSIKNKKNDKKDKKKKKGGFPVVPVVLLLLIIGSIFSLLVFDVFNFREQYIMPYVRNAPFIGDFFPPPAETGAESEGQYANTSREELLSIIKALELQVDQLELEKTATNEKFDNSQATINYLRGFESQIESYRQIKEQFDHMIAMGDPNAYKQFFEEISPENAASIYEKVITQVQYSKDIKDLAATYAEMDAGKAAEIFKNLLTTNTALLVTILKNIDVESRAAILNEMDARDGSRITRLMEPESIDLPLATAPPIQVSAPGPTLLTNAETENEAEPEV